MKKKFAYTLAEILIVLGIIGVVSAITLPIIIQNYKKQVYSSRLKKFYSSMNQAILMYNTENGVESKDWNVPKSPNTNSTAAKIFWNTYFAKYFKNVLKTEVGYVNRYDFYVYFNDGTYLDIHGGDGVDVTYWLDKRNRFTFYFSPHVGKFVPFIWNLDAKKLNDRNYVKNQCKNNSAYCTQLLYLDNWEFKKDYPHKL